MHDHPIRNYAEPVPEQSEHLSVAANFTEEIMSRFNEFEVNEILLEIKALVTSSRQTQIEELSYRLKTLEGSLEQLHGGKSMRPEDGITISDPDAHVTGTIKSNNPFYRKHDNKGGTPV